jgi:uncharacterized protein YdeI (YjbR/CyaY-like superfamily)
MANKKSRTVRKRFTAVLEPDGTALKWTIARIPFDPAKAWPMRKGRRVRGEIEGFAFRTTLFPRPGGEHLLLVNKKMQAGAGVRMGEKARIWLEPDLEEREILLPLELKRELNTDRGLRKWFDGLSESMRREIGKWADEPKTPASRKKRAEKMAERLMHAMEGEEEPPPILKAIFQRQPRAREAWFAQTPTQRRSHLMGIFYYETVEGRERRATKAIEEAAKKTGNSE